MTPPLPLPGDWPEGAPEPRREGACWVCYTLSRGRSAIKWRCYVYDTGEVVAFYGVPVVVVTHLLALHAAGNREEN